MSLSPSSHKSFNEVTLTAIFDAAISEPLVNLYVHMYSTYC